MKFCQQILGPGEITLQTNAFVAHSCDSVRDKNTQTMLEAQGHKVYMSEQLPLVESLRNARDELANRLSYD